MSDARFSPDEWRGHCLNYFARFEAAVSKSLEAAKEAGRVAKIRHLAGQQLADLIVLSEEVEGTSKQLKAFSNALNAWQIIEPKRQFLAHGVGTLAHEQNGDWLLLLDVNSYRSNVASFTRWAVREKEAEHFATDLTNAFKAMSGQLGHFRKRIQQK